jgi:hypothetical protein
VNKYTETGLGFVALSFWALALVACGAGAVPPPSPSPPPEVNAPSQASPPEASSPGTSTDPAASGAPTAPSSEPLACKLPAPKKSGDACKTDADCGPSAPCHAPACVAKAKSPPKPPDLMCTMSFGCDTADANRCGCYEGSCALIPPT